MADDVMSDIRPIVTRAEAVAIGIKRYFTGKPCRHGHISERFTSTTLCVECNREWSRIIRKTNPSKKREKDRKYRNENRDKVRENNQKRYAIWKKNNPGAACAHARNCRSRRATAKGSHTAADIARIREAQRDRCANPACRIKLHGKGHVDHIQPLARGGSNWPRNLQLLCEPCNRSKHAKDPIEFMRAHGMLL